MPLSAAVIKALPRALSLTAAAVAAATTSLLLISAVVSRTHHLASDPPFPPPPYASAATTAPQAPAPAPDPDHHHDPPPPPPVPPCPPNATQLVPCHDHESPSGERHCPPRPPPPPHPPKDPPPHPPHPPPPPPHCRVPPPPGYRPPPPWPVRRERARYANVELPPRLPAAELAAGQDPVRGSGEWLVFTGGKGVRNYVDQLARVVPLRGGVVRTALDIGCGVASFGDYLLNYGVLTMSIARGAQVQLALERGLPAMIGALVAHRLPYPSRSFDMVHCADCFVPWTAHADSRWALHAGN